MLLLLLLLPLLLLLLLPLLLPCQVDNEPSIRANTTVLLGNVAQYLGDTYCKKVSVVPWGHILQSS
jgi:hypothetical protein